MTRALPRLLLAWNEADHPREEAGRREGGRFAKAKKSFRFVKGAKDALREYNAKQSPNSPKLTLHDAAECAGALSESKLYIWVDESDRLVVKVEHPDYNAIRLFYGDVIKNEDFNLNTDTGQGLGTKVFASQVSHASRLGFKNLHALCAGKKDDDLNGYYTWPRLGYDADLDKVLDKATRDKAREMGPIKVSEFMKTKEGREWWKENGSNFIGTFDLGKNSQSRKVLAAYVREKRQARAKDRVAAVALSRGRGDTRRDMGQPGLEWALRADADLRRVESAALPDAREALLALRDRPAESQRLLVEGLAPRLARALAAAELMGRRSASGPAALELDYYSVVSRQLAEAGLRVDLDKAQRGYAARAYKVLGSLGSKVDGSVRAAVAKARAAGLKPNKAVSEVSKVLAKLGVDVTGPQLETLFRTEIAVAFSAGQWQEWRKRWDDIWGFRYVTVGDDRVRKTHAAMDGASLPKDDPVWDVWVPPNGWNCRCRLVPIYKTPGVKPKKVKPLGRPRPDEGFARDFGGGAALSLAWDALALDVSSQARVPAGQTGGGRWTKEKSGSGWPSWSELKEVSSLGGSTGAKLMEGPDGKRYVLKRGASEAHAENEHKANKLYEHMGVPVPKSTMVQTPTGKALLLEFIKGKTLNQLTGEELKIAEGQARANFAADALLGNWDVVGLSRDNMVLGDDGILYRVDNGGALAFRAKGGPKGAKWNGEVSELKSMREAGEAGKLFGKLTDKEVEAQVVGLLNKVVMDDKLKKLESIDPMLFKRMHKMAAAEGQHPWPWSQMAAAIKAAPTPVATVKTSVQPQHSGPKTYWQMSHHEKVKELGAVAAAAGMTNHQLHQAALMNVDEHDKKAYVSWYWDEEQKKAIAGAFPNKTPKVVEASKYIKKKYGYTTKELAKKIEDPEFGKALASNPVTAATPSVKPKKLPQHFPTYQVPEPPGTAKAFGSLTDHKGPLKTGKQTNWASIETAAQNTASTLPVEQREAIAIWTSSAHNIRAAAIKPDQAEPHYKKLLVNFEAGLDKCETHEGHTYRWISHVNPGNELYAALTTENSTVEFLAPACSARKSAGYGTQRPAVLRLRGKSASIEHVGYHTSEQEAVIRRGSVYRVIGYSFMPVEEIGEKRHVFDLEQVHDAESKAAAKKLALSLGRDSRAEEDRFTEDDPDSFLDVRFPLSAIIGDR